MRNRRPRASRPREIPRACGFPRRRGYNPLHMKIKAATPDAYVKSLAQERRLAIAAVRKVILDNLPEGYQEIVDFGMLMYVVPLRRFPDTYNGRPLAIVALASQKQYLSLYLMCVYGDPKTRAWFEAEFRKAGKKLDIGKSCVRFRKIEDLPLDVIGQAVARVPVAKFLGLYRKSRTGKSGAATRVRKA